MAAAVTAIAGLESRPERVGKKRRFITDITITSYTTGGDTLTAATLGLQKVYMILFENKSDGTRACYIPSTSKVKCFAADGTELTATTNTVFRGEVIGL